MRMIACSAAVGLLTAGLMVGGGFAASGCKRTAEAHDAPVDPTDARQMTPATTPAAPAPSVVTFDDKGAHFQYAGAWRHISDPDYELHLVRGSGDKACKDCDITFDVPDLPWHPPGMIRLGLIEHGYVDDLKKKYADVHTDSSADFPVPDECKAKMLQYSWSKDGVAHHGAGLLMMRKETVYILSCTADAKNYPDVKADFDKIVSSLHFGK